jgi:hypothetical protein
MSKDLLNSWEFVGLVVALLLACGFGVYSILRPGKPNRIPALLGYRGGMPSPLPSPKASPSPARK